MPKTIEKIVPMFHSNNDIIVGVNGKRFKDMDVREMEGRMADAMRVVNGGLIEKFKFKRDWMQKVVRRNFEPMYFAEGSTTVVGVNGRPFQDREDLEIAMNAINESRPRNSHYGPACDPSVPKGLALRTNPDERDR